MTQAEASHVQGSMAAGVFAGSCMWASLWLMVPVAASYLPADANLPIAYALSDTVGQFLGVLMICLAARAWVTVIESVLGTVLLSAASVLSLAPVFFLQMSDAALGTLGLVHGLVNSFLWLHLTFFLIDSPSKEVFRFFLMTMLGGAAAVLIKLSLKPEAAIVFLTALVPISYTLFYAVHQMQSAERRILVQQEIEASASFRKGMNNVSGAARLLPFVSICGVSFGFHVSTPTLAQDGIELALIGAIFFFPGVVMLVTNRLMKKSVNFRNLSSIILVMMVAVLIPWPVQDSTLLAARGMAVLAIFTLFDLSWISTLLEIGSKNRSFAPYAILFGRFVILFTVSIGAFLRFAIDRGADSSAPSIVDYCLVLLLVAAFCWFSAGSSFLDVKAKQSPAPLMEKIEFLAEEYGLSKREAEILAFCARGYSAKGIAAQLLISNNTVKTHTSHIYAKLDVHTQQELIEFVESTSVSGQDPLDVSLSS